MLTYAFIGGTPGMGEMLLVLVVALLLFGSKRLPQIARNLGKAMENFRKATREVSGELIDATKDAPIKPGGLVDDSTKQDEKSEHVFEHPQGEE